MCPLSGNSTSFDPGINRFIEGQGHACSQPGNCESWLHAVGTLSPSRVKHKPSPTQSAGKMRVWGFSVGFAGALHTVVPARCARADLVNADA
jgi:hypothetical protein